MTVEELRAELDGIVAGLTASGFGSIDPEVVEKLDACAAAAGEADMKEGKRLLENLAGTMKAIRDGASKAESGGVRLTALEFYLKKLSDNGIVEEP